MLDQVGMNNKVVEVFKKHIDSIRRVDANDEKLYKNAVKFMSVGDYDSALKLVDNLCKRFPFNTIFLKTMASCFQKQEKYQAAIMVYKTAHILIPNANLDCIYFCGVCYFKIGALKEAKSCFLDFLNKNSGNEMHKKRATLYLNKMKFV